MNQKIGLNTLLVNGTSQMQEFQEAREKFVVERKAPAPSTGTGSFSEAPVT